VFTARYALSPYIKQIRFVFKGLILFTAWQSGLICAQLFSHSTSCSSSSNLYMGNLQCHWRWINYVDQCVLLSVDLQVPGGDAEVMSVIAGWDLDLYILIPSCYPPTSTILSMKFLVTSVCSLGHSYHVEHTVHLTAVFKLLIWWQVVLL
jgi:hypothetical protein